MSNTVVINKYVKQYNNSLYCLYSRINISLIRVKPA